jgi:hypothetical protein
MYKNYFAFITNNFYNTNMTDRVKVFHLYLNNDLIYYNKHPSYPITSCSKAAKGLLVYLEVNCICTVIIISLSQS